jgi:hypothetical protein
MKIAGLAGSERSCEESFNSSTGATDGVDMDENERNFLNVTGQLGRLG